VSDVTIKPTTKFLKAGTLVVVLVFLALEAGCYLSWNAQVGSDWLMILPALLLLWPAARALRRQLTTTTITGDRLRYETGGFAKSTRTIQLSKLQDVRVDQRFMQRIFGVGDLSIETAGEASRLTIHNADNPQALADEIMNRAQIGGGIR
jgi:uncharacterized membrane protein YdbT with pleckstrin-like domain